MKQVIIIHGGTTFSAYDKYLNYLRTKNVTIDRLIPTPSWKDSLQAELGKDYQVLTPSMPNATNAQYEEWKIWFERLSDVIKDNCILIGHSLGGIFLAKYLSENQFPRHIAGTVLLAAPYDDETDEDLGSFKMTELTSRIEHQAGKITLIYGEDDPVVSAEEVEKYRRALPHAKVVQLPAPDHFVRAQFPEITTIIKSI